MQFGMLQPLFHTVHSLADIAQMAGVCKAWCDAAHAEKRAWQQKVLRAMAAQERGAETTTQRAGVGFAQSWRITTGQASIAAFPIGESTGMRDRGSASSGALGTSVD